MPAHDEVVVRRARESDLPRLTAIAFAAKRQWGYPEEWIQGWRNDLTFTPELLATQDVWVAVMADDSVGVAASSHAEGAAEASLEHLWVAPEHWGAGVGTTLLRHAMHQVRQAGAQRLRVISDPHAESFYRRRGAAHVGTTPSTPPGRRLPVLEFDLST